jgi:hypothetical protein
VVYRDVTRQAKGLYRLKHAGALRNGLAYLSRYNSSWFCHISHALSFVKSFWPEARLEAFTQGVAAECSEEQFNEYLQEAQPVAEQIVKSVLQD